MLDTMSQKENSCQDTKLLLAAGLRSYTVLLEFSHLVTVIIYIPSWTGVAVAWKGLCSDEARAELRRLHPGKAERPDGMCPRLLKDCAAQLAGSSNRQHLKGGQ